MSALSPTQSSVSRLAQVRFAPMLLQKAVITDASSLSAR
jgi:hypothetical protein